MFHGVALSAAVDIIEWATDFWNDRINEVFHFLITPPPNLFSDESGHSVVWSAMETIHGALLPVAVSILAIVFLVSIIKSTTDIEQLKSGETIMRHITRFVIAYAIMRGSLFIFKGIMSVMQELVVAAWEATSGTSMSSSMTFSDRVPESVAAQINRAGTWDKIIYVVVCFVAAVAIVVMSIKILLTVYSRFFKIYLFVAVSAVPLTFLVSQEHRHTAWRFLKSFLALLLVGVLIIVACVIYHSVADFLRPDMPEKPPTPEHPDYPSMKEFLLSHGCPEENFYVNYGGHKVLVLDPSLNGALSSWLNANNLYDEYMEIFHYWMSVVYPEDPPFETNRKAVFLYLGWRVFTMFILVATIQAADNISKEMLAG